MATKRPGRPTKHDWSDKRDICYRLYIDEHKSIKEIIEHFTATLCIDPLQVPSARDFSRQFYRWQFPSRRDKLSPEDEERLVERIKELWQANYGQKQMFDVLANEGWQIDQQMLSRLRRKHGVMLRVAAGYNRENMGPGSGKKRKAAADEAEVPQPDAYDIGNCDTTAEAARRAQRLMDIQANSDAQFNARKRRRRIRGYAHLPADAPGLPPRYKSETSLDECKAFLNLSNELYKRIRQDFEVICNDLNIIKKRFCNNGEWEAAKTRLIRESIHLSAMLNPVHENLAERENALEVVCADVTKRMRNMKKRIFVQEANNILGLNPEASKELRRQFYEILKADNFQTMLLCGREHWEELKQQWYNSCEVVQQLYAQGMDEERKKCLDVLVRDAMKRHNDNNVTKIPHLSQHNVYGPGPGPARRTKEDHYAEPVQPVVEVGRHMELDPALFAALSSNLTAQAASIEATHHNVNTPLQPQPTSTLLISQAIPIPAYFRLSPDSHIAEQHPKMWLATLEGPNIHALHVAATMKTRSAKLTKILGIVKGPDGRDDHYQIDGSDELEAYLETIKDLAGGKATFVAVLDEC